MLWELKSFKCLFSFYLFLLLVYPNPVLAKGNHSLVKSETKTKSQVVVRHNKKFKKIRRTIIEMIESGKIPSLAVGVAQEGKIIWEEAFGWADIENKKLATPYTVYPIASVSKSLSGTAILLLVEQGRVNLGDPVEKYISPVKLQTFEGYPSKITVGDILNMTAGIPHGGINYKMNRLENQMKIDDFVAKY